MGARVIVPSVDSPLNIRDTFWLCLFFKRKKQVTGCDREAEASSVASAHDNSVQLPLLEKELLHIRTRVGVPMALFLPHRGVALHTSS